MPFFLRLFRQELKQLVPKLQLVDVMKDTLLEIARQDDCLGIVTSNARQNVEEFLYLQGLDRLLEFIYAGQVFLGKARVLKQLVKRYSLAPKQAICLSNETCDLETATQAGLRSVAVSWDFNSCEALAKYNPDILIDRPEQLLPAIKRIDNII
jgi:phosphoglycolate phosphatase